MEEAVGQNKEKQPELSPLENSIAEKFQIPIEKAPAVRMDFYFLWHGNNEDADILREPIKQADIILTEWAGGGNQIEEEFLDEVTHGLGMWPAFAMFNAYEDPGSFRYDSPVLAKPQTTAPFSNLAASKTVCLLRPRK